MAKFIEREAAIQCRPEALNENRDDPTLALAAHWWNKAVGQYVDNLQSIPAADVRPIVYCRDCMHAEESMVSGCVYCNEMERARINEGWCAWGEKKEEE